MKPEPPLIEKIEDLNCLQELEGAEGQIEESGRMTLEVRAAIATRRAHLQRLKLKK